MKELAIMMCVIAMAAMAAAAESAGDPEADPRPEADYNQKYRPQFHYTTKKGWINDPIGLVHYKGEYHIFNDHNVKSCGFPGGIFSGEQSHWSHAISKDLVHWRHMPVAVYPDKLGACWSGSGVVDWKNTAGFQTGKEPPLVLAYTSAGSWGQSLVYSNDRGRTWKKYKKNPVVKGIAPGNRDPMVFRHEPTKKWVMVLYVRRGSAHFFNSDDLKAWTATSVVPLHGFHECPDLFELPVDGDPKNKKWVLYDARFQYWIGSFDGKTFKREAGPLRGDYGGNFYAAQSWHNTGNRRVQIGWMRGGRYPGMPFNQQMSFPCELTLRTTEEGIRLYRWPVKEIKSIHKKAHRVKKAPLKPGDNPLKDIKAELLDLHADITMGSAKKVVFNLRGSAVTYDGSTLTTPRGQGALKPRDGRITVRILVDRGSVEVFGNEGRLSLTTYALHEPKDLNLALTVEGGEAVLNKLIVNELKSAWK